MKNHVSFAVILTLLLTVIAVAVSINTDKTEIQDTKPAVSENTSTSDEAEMRGLWVSYISLDMSGTDYSEKAFIAKFEDIAKVAKKYGCNALFVHVRAFCDALYKSDIFPGSHILWGEQGKEAGYDALEIMTEISEENGLEIHAWINPYRVTNDTASFALSNTNPYMADNSLGIECQGGIYLNPAKKDVRELIVNGIKEIIENYNIDGIHFDDYFYPTADEDFDRAEYNQYLKAFATDRDALPLTEWRKNNVNMLIAEVYRTIKDYDKNITFGISPQGNIDNCLSMGADVKSWCECVGYVDYICPQLYFSLENPALKFEAGLDRWLEYNLHRDLKIYAGLGAYKAGSDADNGTWLESEDILKRELEIIRDKNTDGYILYDYEALLSTKAKKELENFKNGL